MVTRTILEKNQQHLGGVAGFFVFRMIQFHEVCLLIFNLNFMKNKKGFAWIPVLLIALGVIVVSGVAYKVGTNKSETVNNNPNDYSFIPTLNNQNQNQPTINNQTTNTNPTPTTQNQTSPNETANWKTYTGVDYTIKFPPNWYTRTVSDPDATIISSYSELSQPWPEIRAKIEIHPQNNSEKLSPKNWYNNLTSDRQDPDTTIEAQPITIDGAQAYVRVDRSLSSDGTVIYLVYLQRNDKMYYFWVGGNKNFEQTLFQILSTFKFTIPTQSSQPSITLLSPNGGEIWAVGSKYTIKWNTKNIPSTDKVSITLGRIPPPPLPEEGQEFDPIIFTDLSNTGSKEWTISYMYPAGNYIITINGYHSLPLLPGNYVSDQSDKSFKITSSLATITQAEAEALVARSWGICSPDGCSRVVVTISQGNTITAIYSLLDDSTSQKKEVAKATYQNGAWVLGQSIIAYSCHRGHIDGSQGFSSSLCI